MSEPLHRLGIAELHAAFADGATSAGAVTEHHLERIRALDPSLRAFIDIDEAGAEQAAAESGVFVAGAASRALEGVPVAIKANIDVAGLATSAGMEARRDMVATADADAVARLRGAGAVVLGTLNMHEAALGADTDNPWFGRAFNPHGQYRTPGGSSGGSGAAVAAGLCVAALGTDTLGSVRIPAAYCGVYGLKPTRGLVSQQGLALVAAGFDTIGPLARSLDDLAAVLRTISDAPEARPIREIVLMRDLGGVRCEPGVLDGYTRALDAFAAQGLLTREMPLLDLKAIRLAGFIRTARELGGRLAALRAERPEGFSPSLSFLLDYGSRATAKEVAAGDALLADSARTLADAISDGALLLPATPQAAFVQGSGAPSNQADFTALASIAGLPALAVPAGVDADGMPVAVQLVGAAGNDLGLIDLARRIDFGIVHPPLF